MPLSPPPPQPSSASEGTHAPKPAPLVSVLVASYNHAPFVRQCIESVLAQTYPNVELIVLDDGSTDHSPALLAKLAKRHDFYYARHANMGLTATLNKAISLARGEYIAPLGSDDLIYPGKLSTQVAFMSARPDVGICGGNALIIDAAGQPCGRPKFSRYAELDFVDVFKARYGPFSSSLMLRSQALAAAGGYAPDIRLEDLYIYLRITKLGYKIVVLDDLLSQQRLHAHNTWRQHRFVVENVLKTYALYADEPGYERVVNRFLIRMFLRSAGVDKTLAIELLKQIPVRRYNKKVLRGLFRLALSAAK